MSEALGRLGAPVERAKRAQSGALASNGTVKMGGARWVQNPTVQHRPRLATIEQAAAYLGLGGEEKGPRKKPNEQPEPTPSEKPEKPKRPCVHGARSVWRLIDRGVLTPVRLPGCRRTLIEWAELDRLIEDALEDGRAR